VEPASGRLELTMIRPLLVDWRELKPGLRLKGKVIRLEKFGAFVDIGAEKPGLVHVSEMSSGYVSNPADVVKVGDEIDVTVLDIDRKKRQIRLSMKVVEVEVVEEQEAESEAPLPTAMEVALRQAMEKSEAGRSREAMAGTGSRWSRKTQEDIISRTLQTRARSTSSE
jgi:small subunit ribosomal protein S1